ncbi:lyase family protein [Microbacterium terricola]|uniref:3-carboxy-cis,cis-muconate cycloisomerase n=1 Tax=Microbacterium terricola TaxID=344163 RepID=A0ABM8E1D9_9MICO|nr:lyase family protein [Microbacterium terricola]UYK40501.1 lyase family protein [Microbacterium terricola]BDV31774.1 3-carboxy-cis,cis-muconate cycloisomerase [Microbacterium terricola]
MPTEPAFDAGLLSPVTVGHDGTVSDAAVLDALVAVEVALTRAWAAVGVAPTEAAEAVSSALGWQGAARVEHHIDLAALAAAGVSGGNPVIPLVAQLKESVPSAATAWVHAGATSQDILDTAVMLVASRAVPRIVDALRSAEHHLTALAVTRRDQVAAARTLTQHAVPTTVGLRAATWLRGIRRAADRLEAVELPAQLGGAGGTLAAFVAIAAHSGADAGAAVRLPAAFAAELGLRTPEAPWHVTRWPVTELGDALVQAIDAVGKLAADVATLSRTEIGEVAEGSSGGSSAMPQKQNPARSVLLRSAALRAPQLGATLHLAAAFAVDERPDGAWHAEWPTLRELLRLALGAAANADELAKGLVVDDEAVTRNLGLTRGLIVAERLSHEPDLVARAEIPGVIAAVSAGTALADVLGGPRAAEVADPTGYTGLAGPLTDAATGQQPDPSLEFPDPA